MKKWKLLVLSTIGLWIIVAVVAAVIMKPQDFSLNSAYVHYVLTRGGMLASATLLYAWFTRGREWALDLASESSVTINARFSR